MKASKREESKQERWEQARKIRTSNTDERAGKKDESNQKKIRKSKTDENKQEIRK